jgi:capsular exopolysaccharide synthesis family protein
MTNTELHDPVLEDRAMIKSADAVPAPMVLKLGDAEEERSSAFSFGLLWQAIVQRLKLATPVGIVLAAIAGTAVWYATEPRFSSHATLQILERPPYLAFQTGESSSVFAQTQIELLRGPFIVGRAIDSEGLALLPELRDIAGKEDAVLWINKRLKAIRIGQSEIFEVSFTTRHPESARRVVDAIVETYMQFQTSESDAQRQRVLEVLKEEAARLNREIELKRAKLRELAKLAGGEDGIVMDMQGSNGGAASAVGRFALLASLQQKLVAAEVDIEFARARMAALAVPDESEAHFPDSQLEAALAADTEIAALKRDLQHRQATLRTISDSSPKRVQAAEDVKKIEHDLEARKAKLQSQLDKEARERGEAQRRDALAQAQAELSSKQQSVGLLRERIRVERDAQADHGDKSLEVQFARNELQNVENVHRQIADRIIQLTTESRALAQVRKIEKAKLPEFPEWPTLGKMIAMAGTAAFFVPFALLVGWDLGHRRVFERQQLERAFDVKLVSEVAALPLRSAIPRPGGERAYRLQAHLFEESVNALRTSLSVHDQLRDCRVFAVASAVSGEGKSNLSAQLAMSWSHAIHGRVVIVDADLRAPKIYELFDVQPGPGLAEVLRGECTLEDALVMDWGDRLYVLPAGNAATRSPSHLFSRARLETVLAQLRTQFEKIIIDVPPVLCASEALVVGKHADGVLLCARHDYSRSGQIKQAYDRLVNSGVNVVGAVLTGTPARRYAYSYRGYAPS